jgi:TonB-linked SusC/RagA family outer membrane protein
MFKLQLHSINIMVCILGLVCLNYAAKAQKRPGIKKKTKTAIIQEMPIDSGIDLGYTKQKKADITGAVSVVQDNNIKELVPVSVDALLQGQAAGMQVTNVSGAPGSGALTTIRGVSTINAGSSPLYVIDGIPLKTYRFVNPLTKNADNNPLADINPDDIESITVLKDAQATALYGMRGSNGVVIITTSGGTAGKTYLDFSGYTGVMSAPNALSVLNADDYRNFILEKERSRGLSQQAIANGMGRYLLVSTPQNQIERYNNNTNWQNELLKRGVYNNYHLKLRGGDAIARYALNVGYTNQSGTIDNSKYERFTTRFNLDYKVNRKLTILNTISYARTDKTLQDEGNEPNTSPLYLATLKSPMLAIWSQDLTGANLNKVDSADYLGKNNPYAVVNRMKNVNSTNRIMGAITGQYTFSKYLTLNSTISADYLRLDETRFRPGAGFVPENEAVRSSSENNTSETMLLNENTLNYNKLFGNHSISAMIGNAFQSTEQQNQFALAINSPSDEFTSISATDPQLIDSISSYEPAWKLISFFGSVNYAYKGKYLIGANLRADGSSRFAKGKQWGYFPSVGIAWRVSSEPFFKNKKLINELKLRLSYGLTGNQEVGYYGSYTALVPANYNNQPGVRFGMVGNPDFTWEKTRQFNAGIDLSILKRLSITADAYIKDTRDLLNYVNLPGISGFSSYVVNGGSVRNTGVELTISGKVLTGRLGWQANLTAAYNKNKILGQAQNQEPITNYGGYQINSGIGSSIGAFYGYNAIGVYRTTADVKVKNGADNAHPFQGGDIIFEDVDKNGVIDQNDMKNIGKNNPDLFGGFSNVFSYKSFDLNIFMDFALGRDIYNAQRASLEAMSGYDNQSTSINNRWRADGDATSMPRLLQNDVVGNTRFSSRWIEDGSYLRFKAVTIGYNIPVKESRKVFKSARILFTAQNLYTFTKYKGYGPEIGSITNPITYSVDYGNVPQLRAFVLGLHLGL